MQKSKNAKTDGLPVIAEQVRKNKVIMVVVMVAALVVIGVCYINGREHKEDARPIEESYTLSNEASSDPKVVQAGALPAVVNGDPKEVPLSKEAIAARVAFIQEKQQELQQRLLAPLMVSMGSSMANDKPIDQDEQKNGTQSMDNSMQKAAQTVKATTMGSLGTLIAEGSFIHAILEPATQSDLPGSLRAVVSEPSYAEDGSRVLIPRGSRLIGQYKSGIQQGQSRIFIVWSRLITPEGVSVQIGSQGVDSLGEAGMGADSINRHFWERFGTSSLLSLIGAGAATLGVSGGDQENSASAYRSAIANSFTQSAHESLKEEGSIAPTLKSWQGKPIMVFVARDLQFDAALKSISGSVSIF